jgi:hypothetical protein
MLYLDGQTSRWLEIRMFGKDQLTGPIRYEFSWFSSVLHELLSWYTFSTFRCMLLMQNSQY